MKRQIKLNLRKEVISDLSPNKMNQVIGGTNPIEKTVDANTCLYTQCDCPSVNQPFVCRTDVKCISDVADTCYASADGAKTCTCHIGEPII
jgi:hypothetical protein